MKNESDGKSSVFESADKTCSRCKQKMPRTPEFFGRNKTKEDGLSVYCKSCVREISRQRKQDIINGITPEVKKKTKRCPGCGETKPRTLEFFGRHRGQPGGISGYCKECIKKSTAKRFEKWAKENPEKRKAAYRRWCSENPDKIRNSQRKTLYGVSAEEFSRMLADQNGCCAICGEPPATGKVLCLDHDHATGLPRGLLCNRCNSGLGNFLDRQDFLEKAIAYLGRTKSRIIHERAGALVSWFSSVPVPEDDSDDSLSSVTK